MPNAFEKSEPTRKFWISVLVRKFPKRLNLILFSRFGLFLLEKTYVERALNLLCKRLDDFLALVIGRERNLIFRATSLQGG